MDREAHKEHRELGAHVEGIAREVFEAGLTVHRALGPGLLESTYEHCLAFELHSRELAVSRQLALPIAYRGVTLDAGYRLDLLVGDAVVVEIKAVEALTRLHEAQVLTYLRLSARLPDEFQRGSIQERCSPSDPLTSRASCPSR